MTKAMNLTGLKILGISCLTVFTVGCSTMSKEQCQMGDWYGMGFADGAAGRMPSYFNNHIEACNKHGIKTNSIAWEKGRQQGIKSYCTPDNAYRLGEKGDSVSPVCGYLPAIEKNTLLMRNMEGKKIYHLNQEILKRDRRLRQLERQVDDNTHFIHSKNRKNKLKHTHSHIHYDQFGHKITHTHKHSHDSNHSHHGLSSNNNSSNYHEGFDFKELNKKHKKKKFKTSLQELLK